MIARAAATVSLAVLLAAPAIAQTFPGANLGPANFWVTLGAGPWGMASFDWHGSTWLARGPIAIGARVAGGTQSGTNRVRVATSALVGFRPQLDRKTLVIALGAATAVRTDVTTCSSCGVTDESAFLKSFAPSMATEFSFDPGYFGFGAALAVVGGKDSFASLTLMIKLGASHSSAELRRSR